MHGYGMQEPELFGINGAHYGLNFISAGIYCFFNGFKRYSGRGEKFKNLSYGDMSKYLIDNAAGVKNLINLGYVDSQRIGAWGWVVEVILLV